MAGVVAVVVVVVLAVGIWVLPALTGRSNSPPPGGAASPSGVAVAPSALPSPASSPAGSPAVTRGTPTSTTLPGGPFGVTGSMAVLGNDGSLSLVDATGRSVLLSPAENAFGGFPAWSPDGTRIAAIRADPAGNSILVYDAGQAASGQPVEPVVILRSSAVEPFYLSWTPNSRSVSFLAAETSGLSLRIAPADGSAPLDGSGAGAKLQTGNPLYFDWIEQDRLLAHVGTGPFAFLGEVGVGGASPAPALEKPGDFRPAVISNDRKYVSYVRAGTAGSSDVVVAARDGSSERTMPVLGMAAVTFDPTSDTIASIGPTETPETAYAIPLGPLRLMDPSSGKVRTLLDGQVVSFWWSPDGRTIAALRVQPVDGPTASPSPSSPSSSPIPSPTAEPTEVRLLFVDVATGDIGAQHVVMAGQLFIDQFLTYFDQYALSHRIWAPDNSSILIPVADPPGTTRIAVMYRNGDPPRLIDGAIGFWSP
jgi:TolB protein